MKHFITILILLIYCFTFVNAQTVNGEISNYEGKKILKVWGTHYERGYAHGYLLADNILDVIDNYLLGFFFQNNIAVYEYSRQYVIDNFNIEDKYLTECEALIDGMEAAGVDIYNQQLGREYDKYDVLVSNSIVDLTALRKLRDELDFGCSSLSSWGNSTQSDTELNGSIVITRNMDWTANQTLFDNHLLLVNLPEESTENAWISFTFPGMIGALSAINEFNLSASMNMGNINYSSNEANLHPIFFSIRNGIEVNDYDENDLNQKEDIWKAINDKNHLSGSIIHAADINAAQVIETNNQNGSCYRTFAENTMIPEYHLAATNHFRELYEPVYCYRYQGIADSLDENSYMSKERSWQVLAGAAGISTNLHAIQYVPSLNYIRWSTATGSSPAYQNDSSILDTEELFASPVSIDDSSIDLKNIFEIYPNPTNSKTTFKFCFEKSKKPSNTIKLEIYNLKGQKIRTLLDNQSESNNFSISWDGKNSHGDELANGLYLYKLEINEQAFVKKIIMLK